MIKISLRNLLSILNLWVDYFGMLEYVLHHGMLKTEIDLIRKEKLNLNL